MNTIAEVVTTGACSGCGLCAAACPAGAIAIRDGCLPMVLDGCTDCGICHELCPRVEMPYSTLEQEFAAQHAMRVRDEFLGYYTRIFLARAADEETRHRAYSGGTTTAFVRHLLQQGRCDAALLTDKAHDGVCCVHPKPRVATTPAGALACAGTKPAANPLLAHLPVPGARVVLVGCSCHIEAVRKAQFLAKHGAAAKKRAQELVGNIVLLVGLNCFFANRPGGIDILLAGMGLQESMIKRWFYDRGIPSVELPDGTVQEVPGGNKNFTALNLGCLLCYPSYTARLSDVTFGKTMSRQWGWNDVVCRSRPADTILTEMESGGLIETRPAEEGGAELLEGLLEAGVFRTDAAGYAGYLETGSFSADEAAAEMMASRREGTIRGPHLLRLIQAVRTYSFYEPAVAARTRKNIFCPKLS